MKESINRSTKKRHSRKREGLKNKVLWSCAGAQIEVSRYVTYRVTETTRAVSFSGAYEKINLG